MEASASDAPSSRLCAFRSRHDDLNRRQIGSLRPRTFARRAAGVEDVIRRMTMWSFVYSEDPVNTISFNYAGDRLISSSEDRQIVFWDWMVGRKKICYESGHSSNILQAEPMPFSDDRTVVSCGADGQVRYGQLADRGDVSTKKLGEHNGAARSFAVEPGSPHTFLSCGEDGVVLLVSHRVNMYTKHFFQFDLRHCSPTELCAHSANTPLNSIAINTKNPNYFAVGGSSKFARLYDVRKLETGRDEPVCLYSHDNLDGGPKVSITSVAFSLQEELLVSYSDELIYLFQLFEEEEPQVYKGHRNAEMKGACFFGPNMEYVVSGSDCGHIFIWKKRGGELLAMLYSGPLSDLQPHPHEMFLATSGGHGTVQLWAPVKRTLQALPRDAEKIMERNRRRREQMSRPTLAVGSLRFYLDSSDDEEDGEGLLGSGSPRECVIS